MSTPYLILSPGRMTTHLTLSLSPTPHRLPTTILPLSPPLSFATALTHHCAVHLSLPPKSLSATPLAIVLPPIAFSSATRRAIAHAALALLRMPSVTFLSPLPAARACVRVASATPVLVLHVGPEASVAFSDGVSQVAAVGEMHVLRRLAALAGMDAVADSELHRRAAAAVCVARPCICVRECRCADDVGRVGDVPGLARVKAVEALFDAVDDEMNVAAAISRLLLHETDLYRRAALAGHVVLSGDGASFPGFASRLKAEFEQVCQLSQFVALKPLAARFRVLQTQFSPAVVPCLGGALLCAAGLAARVGVEVRAEGYVSGMGIQDVDCISAVEVR